MQMISSNFLKDKSTEHSKPLDLFFIHNIDIK